MQIGNLGDERQMAGRMTNKESSGTIEKLALEKDPRRERPYF